MCGDVFGKVVSSLLVALSPYISDEVAHQHLKPSDVENPIVVQALREAETIWTFRVEKSRSLFVQSTHGGPPIHLRKYTQQSEEPNKKNAMLYLPGLRTQDAKAAQFAFDLKGSLKDADFYVSDLRNQGLSRDSKSPDQLIDIRSFTEYQDDYEDMVAYLESQGYEKVVVVSHSTGASGPVLNLLSQRQTSPIVKKVILLAPGLDTSPDIIGAADNFGRLSVSVINNILGPMLLGKSGGAHIAFGYKPALEPVPGERSRRNNSNIKKIWMSYFLRLMALSNIEGQFDQPHAFGPTMNWVLASGRFAHQMIRSTMTASTPVTMYLAQQDYTVNPKAAREMCRRSKNCQYFTLKGLHDLPFEKPEITTLFRHEIEQALR